MILTLGGRRFAVAELDRMSFQQSHYLMRHIRLEGLDAIWPVEGETEDAYEERVRGGIIKAGNLPEVVAGYLVPENGAWSPAIARDTARVLANLTDPAEHAVLLAVARQVAPDFFGRALAWFGTSPLSLLSTIGVGLPRNPIPAA